MPEETAWKSDQFVRDFVKKVLQVKKPELAVQAPFWRDILNQVDTSHVEVLGLVSDNVACVWRRGDKDHTKKFSGTELCITAIAWKIR
jgi:hypothetical protein